MMHTGSDLHIRKMNLAAVINKWYLIREENNRWL